MVQGRTVLQRVVEPLLLAERGRELPGSRAWEVVQVEAVAEGRGRRPGGPTAYAKWKQAEGIPVHSGSYVDDLHTGEVAPWERFGQRGAFISLGDQTRGDG